MKSYKVEMNVKSCLLNTVLFFLVYVPGVFVYSPYSLQHDVGQRHVACRSCCLFLICLTFPAHVRFR